MITSDDTILQEGMLEQTGFDRTDLMFPIPGKITKINYRYSNEETTGEQTPVMLTVNVNTQLGDIKTIPIMRPYADEERQYRVGDNVVIGFLYGERSGAFLMGTLDPPNDPKSRTNDDLEFKKDQVGNTKRMDGEGNKITKWSKTVTDLVVK
jgi:hypothetical protein